MPDDVLLDAPVLPGALAPDLAARPTLLEAAGVSAGYRGDTVVHEVDLRLRAGQVTTLVGPNGSGKSTLLRTLAALHPRSGGQVGVGAPGEARDVDHLSRRELAHRLTLLSQSRPTPGGVTVRELVEYGRHPHRGRWRSADPEGSVAVDRAMQLTGTTHLGDRPVDNLSGGQLQRVWLAACLAQDTPVLLLDEPTTFLDLRYQAELLDIVRDLADTHGIAVGLVLHDLDQAAAVADTVVLLVDGRVVAAGPPEVVLTSEHLTAAYGIAVEVDEDPRTGLLRTRVRARHHERARRGPAPQNPTP
ncbi:ABC transporter ATP-binding protein [Actinotalea sp. C106]|uniref:ABC transporter ATP-binding protein n=1 Tax=Actinotalea sp. C106 TaxID=2908644 RepID=UPI00202976D7|nr:ABC transporter ATP-binding protein [Actinotalea sp. C106]